MTDGEGNYCCLGVLEEKTLGIPFDESGIDAFDQETDPSFEVQDFTKLSNYLTEDEADKLNVLSNNRVNSPHFEKFIRRTNACVLMNDKLKLTFTEIALIVEMFGWDVEESNYMEVVNNG